MRRNPPDDWGKKLTGVAAIAAVGGVGIIGYLVYKKWFGPPPPPPEESIEFVSAMPVSVEVLAGDYAQMNLTWKNISDKEVTAEFRLDLYPGWPHTPYEGLWSSSTAGIGVEQSVVLSCPVPGNWGTGYVGAAIMLKGKIGRAHV